MKKRIKKIYLIVIIILLIGVFYLQYQQSYQEKMIKFDACLESCPSRWSLEPNASERADSCREKCREKYGLTWEKENK